MTYQPRADRPLLAILIAALLVAPAAAQQRNGGSQRAADPDPERFATELAAFASFDSKNAVPAQGVVFVGSSSIRFWPTAERFPAEPVINRGFGGAHVSDVNHYIHETVLKYRPAVVVFYAGDNDIAAGKGRDQVFEDYQAFVDAVLHAKPTTQIVYLPIKPSTARWSLWPEMRATNEMVRRYSEARSNLHYADVATPMIGPEGRPPEYLFVADGLHMTPAGYDIWTEVVEATLAKLR